jgi:hypothetical protein
MALIIPCGAGAWQGLIGGGPEGQGSWQSKDPAQSWGPAWPKGRDPGGAWSWGLVWPKFQGSRWGMDPVWIWGLEWTEGQKAQQSRAAVPQAYGLGTWQAVLLEDCGMEKPSMI